jgi:hypothetical protein
MRRGLAIMAGLVLGASACMAANYYRQMLMLPRAAGAAPPAALTASMLLHFDESNGSTGTVDSGKFSIPILVTDGAKITNSPSKFGNAAFVGQANSSFDIVWTNYFNIGTNDWSVDFWVQADATTIGTNTTRFVMSGSSWVSIFHSSGNPGNWRFDWTTNNGSSYGTPNIPYNPQSISNQWMHIAVYRYTNWLHIATNGVHAQPNTTGRNLAGVNFTNANTKIAIGTGNSTLPLPFVDEYRVMLGENMPYRGTNFTPPTAPYTGCE